MEKDIRVISSEEELKIFSDPYRMKIIRVFQRSKTPLTVKGVADIMGEVPAKVHYHVKKLLKINILELDHTEEINGIIAKYYTLQHKSFTISLKDTDDDQMYQQLTQVHALVSRLIDEFKEEFMKSSSHAVENKVEDESEVGMLASSELCLSEEEFKEVSKYFSELSNKYGCDEEGKKKYVFLAGLGRKLK